MKRLTIITVTLLLIFSGCSKKKGCGFDPITATASQDEQQAVSDYLSSNGLSALKDNSGVYYSISEAGAGSVYPGLCSNVVIKYTGSLTDGTVFDQTTGDETRTFQLGLLIPGFQVILSQITKGTKLKLYIPPSFGYGSQQVGNIPANSILIFDVELVDFY